MLSRLVEQWKKAQDKKEMDKATTVEFTVKLATSNFNRRSSTFPAANSEKKDANDVQK